MTYDAESRVVTNVQSGVTTKCFYDAKGIRVRKCQPDCASPTSSTVYIFGGTQVIAGYNTLTSPPALLREYIYAGGQMLALEEGGATKYFLRDHLSVRVLTDSSGTKIGEQAHYPFGEDWYATGTTTNQMFTSYPHESESGNDYAIRRNHSCRLGRFTTADPVRGRISNPQRLNR